MDWSKVTSKGLKGVATWVVAAVAGVVVSYLADNQAEIVSYVTVAVGGVVAGLITAVTNWLKHRTDNDLV